MNISSQSQSSPIIHFTRAIRSGPNLSTEVVLSPFLSLEYDSQQHRTALLERPQSTPISSPVLHPSISFNVAEGHANRIDENSILTMINGKRRRVTTLDSSSLTNVTPLNEIKNQLKSPDELETSDADEDNGDRYFLRPPPLLVLSQSIRAKHPEQLIARKANHRFSSKADLPNAPANYSLVFYDLNRTQQDEAKRLTRRMGDCFIYDRIDLLTTHVILRDDNPQQPINLDLVLALIYGCHFVTFEWLKCSSRIGEWLGVKRFEPKNFFRSNGALNSYRHSRQNGKSLSLFEQCGLIYVTSIVEQRALLVKLMTLLGGNITLSRDRAQIIVGQSSKSLPIIVHPQVHERWIVDSIKAGQCLGTDKYLIENIE